MITGATSGIGLGTARAFAMEGAMIVFNARNAHAGAPAQEALRSIAVRGQVQFVQADIDIQEQMDSVVDRAVGRLGAMVNNASSGVRVNVVAPGLTATEAVLTYCPQPDQRAAMAAESQPMGRMIEPSEIAQAVLSATSDAATGVTGLTFRSMADGRRGTCEEGRGDVRLR